jgi:hypothetical protein
MKKQDISIQQILDWCLKKTEEGSEIILMWDGGSDSGWVYLEVDGEDSGDAEAEALADMMYEQLDYGSWAGEFSASGEAPFDAETKMFQGTDYYSETESTSSDCKILIRIPKHIHFDDLLIHTEDYDCTTSVDFRIRNGFQHPDTNALETTLAGYLRKEIIEAIKNDNDDIDSYWGDYSLSRESDFIEDGDDVVAVLKNVQYSINVVTEKDVEINLEELLENETNHEL